MRRLLCIPLLLLAALCAKGQDYSYTRYDINDGLAGSTVFCVLLDKQGFMWFGTETGVSRFDGSKFRNFSTYDGLPDNQVLSMFEDSKGRVWMAPFNKSVCYYYKGKIYNQQNDPALRSIQLSGHIVAFAEDSKGNILLQQTTRMHLLRPDNSVRVFVAPPGEPVNFICAGRNKAGNIQFLDRKWLYEIKDGELSFVKKLQLPFTNYRYVAMKPGMLFWRTGYDNFRILNNRFDTTVRLQAETWSSKISAISDSLVSINLQTGTWLFDVAKGTSENFLPAESVSDVALDNEGNLWFCTLNHGVFMLNSKYIRNITLRGSQNIKLGAYTVEKYGGDWLVGADMTYLYHCKKLPGGDYQSNIRWIFKDLIPERVTSIIPDPDGSYWVGTDSRIVHFTAQWKPQSVAHDIWGVKALFWTRNGVLAATGRNVAIVDLHSGVIRDTVWHERSTTVFEKDDTIYVGTLDGLFLVQRSGTVTKAAPPQLRNRIMDIRKGNDGTLWIATYAGVFAYANHQVIASVTEQQGLVSNICKTLELSGNELWVGTNKGLQKIDIANPRKPVVQYMLSNELSSDIINAVKTDSSTLFIATPEGLSVVDKQMVSFNSRCDLYMDKIIVSGRGIEWSGKSIDLANKDNNIRFEFAGISYRSGGDVSYNYRLYGLDTGWRQTQENHLTYPTLPGGDYKLELQAINKFGIKSGVLTVPFTIEKKLWQKPWFQALMVLAVTLLAWGILNWRIRVIRREEAEKSSISKKIAELEQLALKSQMNPHFVFNSLNSIQHYVLDKDIEGANKFITGFSRLIRQTLDISARHEISLAEEINYLFTYLQLEQIRLENKFTFEVVAEAALKPEECFIPPMILQPFVENCIRHGIRFRHDNEGRVSVTFKKVADYLECSVLDNGVGRRVAAQHKSKTPIEYQSRGISLTKNRIELLNRSAVRPIFVNIYDLEESGDTGTRVVISFPIHKETHDTYHNS
jgi:ligand-binding sensor domain-containing protein